MSKPKSKRKRNQFINEFINYNYPDLLISKQEFKNNHKKEIIDLFNTYGWNHTNQILISDMLESYYWYRDPLCYKTCIDNINYTDFNEKFIRLFGKDILKNKKILKKIKAIKNFELNSGY